MVTTRNARRLLKSFCPDVLLEVVPRGNCYTDSVVQKASGRLKIRWAPRNGYTTLLHEIGHLRLRHFGSKAQARQRGSKAEAVMAEAAAWLWAEHAARKAKLPFNYALADLGFRTYVAGVRMGWRYANFSRSE
jgi:hypothetical protein